MRYFGDYSPSNWFYRPIDNLPPRVVIDANVLLDAALIVDGAGIAVLEALVRRKVVLHTTAKAIAEARKTLLRIRRDLPDITPLVDLAVRQLGVLVHDTDRGIHGVKPHDSHLAAAAVDIDAFILTEDMPLLYDLDRARLHGRSLRETLLTCILPDQPHQDVTIFGFGSGADGHVFIKFMPHEDVCNEADRYWFLFDAPGVMSIYYNGETGSFEVAWEAGGTLTLPVKLFPNTQYALCFNYSVGKCTNAQMRVRSVGSESEHFISGVLAALERQPSGEIIVMNSRDENVGWKGTLQNVTFGPYTLNKKVWRACHALVGVAPPTLTADLTQSAAILTEIKGNRVRRPLRQHVLQLTNMRIPGVYPGRGRAERPDEWFD